MKRLRLSGLAMCLMLLFSAPVYAATCYVDAGAAGANDGGSWADAFIRLQDALAAASSGDEIWVAAGSYYPGTTRSSAFQLKNGVAVYGGFAGVETSLAERDPVANETILSGDIGTVGDPADNCFHVFYHPSGLGLDGSAILDGFTITGGNAASDYHPDDCGGGMLNVSASPTMVNCRFWNNAARCSGGAISNSSAAPTFSACLFVGNTAAGGGGIINTFSFPTVTGCIFIGNSAAGKGGAIQNVASAPTISNGTFFGNTAGSFGGAMANAYSGSTPVIAGCILWANSAVQAGNQMYCESSSDPSIRFSCIQNSGGSGNGWDTSLGSDGGGNIDAAPQFVRNPDPGTDAVWGTDDDDAGDLHLAAGSPCIDAGDPAVSGGADMDGESRVADGDCDGIAVADIGADEWVDADCDGVSDYEEALLGTDPSAADTDGDGLSDGEEVNTYGTDPGKADTDGDGFSDRIEIYHDADPLSAGDTPQPMVIYVDHGAGGENSGESWTNAFDDLRTALSLAAAGDEIWVAAGVYLPGDARDDAFRLINGVAVYGGFAGTEISREERDPAVHATILSGNIGDPNDASDNCYHVFYHPTGAGLDGTAILDGVTISGGNADGAYSHQFGGGMFNENASPTLINCTFLDNTAGSGGGMHNTEAAPSLKDCVFRNNIAYVRGGGIYNGHAAPKFENCSLTGNTAVEGGAVFNFFSSPTIAGGTFEDNAATHGGGMVNEAASPNLTACTFSGNTATQLGGAIMNDLNASVPAIDRCIFRDNAAGANGGGMASRGGSLPVLTGCVFAGNTALVDGGAIFNANASPQIVNCTISANVAYRGGALAGASGAAPELASCILFGNSSETQTPVIYNDETSTALIRYSNIENSGGTEAWDGALGSDMGGNIDADPLFVENPGGRGPGDVHLSPGSPCIDAGDPEASAQSDLDGDARITDGDGDGNAVVDMGADERPQFTPGGGGSGGGCFISSFLM